MRILFLSHAFNSLTQRLYIELQGLGHEVSVEFDINDAITLDAVSRYQPDLVIAPFLKRAIPEVVWRKHVCLVVHPGIPGDRGPSALDWAIQEGETSWGVTVLQANAEMDAGDVWAHAEFPMRPASKASLYRREVTEATVQAVIEAVARFQEAGFRPSPIDPADPLISGRLRPLMRQGDRRIDWQRDSSETVLRKIRAADGFPGVLDRIEGRELRLFDAWPEGRLSGTAGELIARCGPAVCRATNDGAVWIGHLLDKNADHPFKLPASRVLADRVAALPEITADAKTGYREIWYEEAGTVGLLYFPFYNGAMSSEQCDILLQHYRQACTRPTKVIVLCGGADFWSNGMHLNLIEAAESAADESWRNINAIDDLAQEVITTESHWTIAALQGNAGAGGVFLARAADSVWARQGVVLNPHYKDMGNLYGSEYWSYLLPRYAGEENALRITQARLPMGVEEARSLGLVDAVITNEAADFLAAVTERARALATDPAFQQHLKEKGERRHRDEQKKPLERYREEELAQMQRNFYGFDPSYHVARYNFVYKVPKSRTPLTIARHRRLAARQRSA